LVGRTEGDIVGLKVGEAVGKFVIPGGVGIQVVGRTEGTADGATEGRIVGDNVGVRDGDDVGLIVGRTEG
jgi:hypothetical protein